MPKKLQKVIQINIFKKPKERIKWNHKNIYLTKENEKGVKKEQKFNKREIYWTISKMAYLIQPYQ